MTTSSTGATPPLSEQIAGTAPDARLEGIERVGHSVLLEDPERANALLREHLSALAV